MARSRANGRSSRQALLDAASELMIERGTIEISLSEIAQKAKLNSALVKYYFGSKQGLLVELVHSLVEVGIDQMRGLAEMKISPTDKLKIHVRGIIKLYFRYPFLNRLIHAMLEDPEAAKEVAQKISIPLATAQKRLLQDGIDQGYFKNLNPVLFYFIIVGACEQIFFARNTLKFAFGINEITEELQREYGDTVIQLILEGLASPQILPAVSARFSEGQTGSPRVV